MDKAIIGPEPMHNLSPPRVELAHSLHPIFYETAPEDLPIPEPYHALSVPPIRLQFPLVHTPLLFQYLEVPIVNLLCHIFVVMSMMDVVLVMSMDVVDFSITMELVGPPCALVGNGPIGVVESAVTMHVVVEPVAGVDTALWIGEGAQSVLEPISEVSLVFARGGDLLSVLLG